MAVAGFMLFANPYYAKITALKEQTTSYNEALDNSKALENERDRLVKKYNSFAAEDLEKLQKLLPDHVDNIRLILEIEKIAAPYGMTLKNVKYDAIKPEEATTSNPGQIQGTTRADGKDYGTWDLEFSTTGSYTNFLSFVKGLEKNLRIVDIASIDFSSNAGGASSSGEIYTYDFTIKTYWLKN